jgi:hypothetical protein
MRVTLSTHSESPALLNSRQFQTRFLVRVLTNIEIICIVVNRMKHPFSPEQFYIHDSTARGRELLANSDQLQEAIRLFAEADEPHKARIPGARVLGAGRYGFTFHIDNMAVKVTSPTSSQESFDKKKPMPPEDLRAQYVVLGALWEHLQQRKEDVTTPEQFFVSHTPTNAFILGQEYMEGWVPVEDRTVLIYGEAGEDEAEYAAVKREIKKLTDAMRQRLTIALGGFALIDRIDDLGIDRSSGIHGGNLLVPAEADLNYDTPLCIIDQPGHELRKRKYAKES